MKHVEHLFKSYPTVDQWHVTSDGQAFEEKHHADAHANSLEKKEKGKGTVTTHKRGDKIEEVEPIQNDLLNEMVKEAEAEATGKEAKGKEAPKKAAPKKK